MKIDNINHTDESRYPASMPGLDVPASAGMDNATFEVMTDHMEHFHTSWCPSKKDMTASGALHSIQGKLREESGGLVVDYSGVFWCVVVTLLATPRQIRPSRSKGEKDSRMTVRLLFS
ncbi:MAG: hypothetical protein HY670_03355 [Chloroflexi bacterium]|nr:hypothetical protein [Chloroflexota bacterium]